MKTKEELLKIIKEIIIEFATVISGQILIEEYDKIVKILINDKYNHKTDCKKITTILNKLLKTYISLKKPKPSEQKVIRKIQTLCN